MKNQLNRRTLFAQIVRALQAQAGQVTPARP